MFIFFMLHLASPVSVVDTELESQCWYFPSPYLVIWMLFDYICFLDKIGRNWVFPLVPKPILYA